MPDIVLCTAYRVIKKKWILSSKNLVEIVAKKPRGCSIELTVQHGSHQPHVLFKLIKINKLKIQLLGHMGHILCSHVARGYHIIQHCCRMFPSSQKVLLDDAGLE